MKHLFTLLLLFMAASLCHATSNITFSTSKSGHLILGEKKVKVSPDWLI